QFGDFYTDEGYRAEEITPIHLELINITGLKLNACEFKDYRTDCGNPGKRAIGINSLDASFRAEALCRFENLQTGIFASNLAANTGSFVANNNRFKACNKGIATSSMSDFFIENNDFLVQLALAETYPADYRLARHYFFAGEFDKYDTLWAAIPNRYSLDEAQEAEFDEIETVLNTVRPNLEAGTLLSRLPEATLD
ncbi:MAG: hypothetical protein KDD09_26700, partial [Phaeodactylibacter sp.]|nr:hypothetical protein [Phaeodactylibacter sp.]